MTHFRTLVVGVLLLGVPVALAVSPASAAPGKAKGKPVAVKKGGAKVTGKSAPTKPGAVGKTRVGRTETLRRAIASEKRIARQAQPERVPPPVNDKRMRFAQTEPNEVDEEIAVLEGELESAALDAVLIDAEPGDKIFDVDANAARAAKVEKPAKPRR